MSKKRRKKPHQTPPAKSPVVGSISLDTSMSISIHPTPPAELPVVGVLSGTHEDLRSVAVCQKVIMGCVIVYLLVWVALVAGQYVLPPMVLFMLLWVFLGDILAGVVFVFLLSTKVYGLGVGILLGILAVVPLLGLIVLLIVNRKATGILRQNGHRIGFLGANLSEF